MILDQDKIIGLAFGLLNQYKEPKNKYEEILFPKITKDSKTFATLDELIIDRQYRNKKFGKKLLKEYLKILKTKKIKKVFLYTDKNSLSHSFYLRMGFTKIGKTNKIPHSNLPSGFEYRVYYYKNL